MRCVCETWIQKVEQVQQKKKIIIIMFYLNGEDKVNHKQLLCLMLNYYCLFESDLNGTKQNYNQFNFFQLGELQEPVARESQIQSQ